MSKVAISGNASGTGTFTIASPATNLDRVLTLPDETTTLATPSSVLTQFNASGSAPVYACRAWVTFDGTKDTTGAVSTANTNRLIKASGNVTSVLRNAAGNYTVTFATAMSDTNFSVISTAGGTGRNTVACSDVDSAGTLAARSTTTVVIHYARGSDVVAVESPFNQLAVYR